MKTINPFLFLLLIVIGCAPDVKQKPPLATIDVVTETLFGKEISDPYRYMENLKDTTVINWFKSQAKYTREILNNISGRQGLIDKMKEFDSRKSEVISSLRITENDKYFYLKRTPKDETGKLFFSEGFKGDEKLLFDPESYKNDTLSYVISGHSPSLDGSKVAFEIAPNGSESSELLILNVDTKKLYPEVIDRCWFASPSWLSDNNSFFYNRLNSSDVHDKKRELNSKSFLHKLNDSPDKDIEVLSNSKYPELGIKGKEFPLVFYGFVVTVDSRLKVFIASEEELKKDKISWKTLIKQEDEIYNFKVNNGEIYAYTPKNASNFKIIKTSLNNPDFEYAEIIVAENTDAKLESFGLTSDGLYFTRSINGVKKQLYFQKYGNNEANELKLPIDAGRINLSTKSINYSEIWVTLAGWTNDYVRYRYDISSNEFVIETLSALAEFPEYENLIVEELMVSSHDGVKVPLSLIYNKNLKMDGNNPVFIYGYGSYGSSINPFFNPSFFLPITKGAILAIAHVRGGGELGDAWYKAGYKTTKPNTWKDLIACSEYLIDKRYTASKKIAIYASSAGGILIGRAMTERPDLFGAAIPRVGCMNTMRAEFSPNGPVNIPEFGTIKDSVECMALYEMDSYHHIVDGTKYPATLIMAGMNDPRVAAWEPAKFAARLQAANTSDNPILFWVDYESGHGRGDTKTKYFERTADVLSFALWQTGHPDFKTK